MVVLIPRDKTKKLLSLPSIREGHFRVELGELRFVIGF